MVRTSGGSSKKPAASSSSTRIRKLQSKEVAQVQQGMMPKARKAFAIFLSERWSEFLDQVPNQEERRQRQVVSLASKAWNSMSLINSMKSIMNFHYEVERGAVPPVYSAMAKISLRHMGIALRSLRLCPENRVTVRDFLARELWRQL